MRVVEFTNSLFVGRSGRAFTLDGYRQLREAIDHTQPSVERIVTRAVTNHALHCGIPVVEAWAKKWLSGEDRMYNAALHAAIVAADSTIEPWRCNGAVMAARAAVAASEQRWAWAARIALSAARWAPLVAAYDNHEAAQRELELQREDLYGSPCPVCGDGVPLCGQSPNATWLVCEDCREKGYTDAPGEDVRYATDH